MPTYEYACKSCGRHLEVVQSFKDEPLKECPHCQGELRKVFSPIGISFKGSGFYKTDSRPAAKSGKGKQDAAAASTESTKSESTKTDSSSSSSTSSSGDSKKPPPKAEAASA